MHIPCRPVLCGLLITACLTACSNEEQKTVQSTPKAALVTVTEAELRDVPSTIDAVGTVEASATVTIVSRVSGELMDVLVREGQYVKKDDLLFVIDKKPAEIALHQVLAQLESDKAKLVKAEQDLARSQKLTSGGFTSAAQNDEARVEAIGYRAAVKVDEAAVEQARLNLSYCEIRAPMDGRAGIIQVDRGNIVTAHTQPLLIIDETAPVDVTFSVPERYLPELRGRASESSLQVTALTKDNRENEGELTFIGNVDSATGTVPLKARFSNADGSMWPGEYTRIKLRLRLLKNVVTVPSRAVTIGPDGTFVYVVGDDMKARYRLVTTSVENNGIRVVTEGLKAGEKVVMEGHVRLADGIDVRFPESGSAQGNNQHSDGAAS